MAEDWAPVGQQQASDWQPVGSPAHRSVMDQLLGIGGPRFQTWPERAVRDVLGVAAVPGQVVQDAQQPKTSVSDSNVSPMSVPAMMGLATMVNPVPPGMRAGEGVMAAPGKETMPFPLARKTPPPTTEQLYAAGKADREAFRQSGAKIDAPAMATWSQQTQQGLLKDGLHPVDAPATFAKLQELENAPPGAVATADNIISLRRSLQNTAQNFNPQAKYDQVAASRAIKGLDARVNELGAGDSIPGVVAGAVPATPGELLGRSNANFSQAFKSNDLTGTLDRARTGIEERAVGRAHAANSGLNLDNNIRQRIESVLEKPSEISGLSDAELAALEAVHQGGKVRNTARYLGNYFGGGGGLGAWAATAGGAGAGAYAGGPVGLAIGAAVPPAIGLSSKAIANALAKRSLNSADKLIRGNSPLYAEMLKKSPTVPASLTAKQAIAKALLMDAMRGR